MASILQNNNILHADVTTVKNTSSNMSTSTSNVFAHSEVEKRYDSIIKSPSDKRDYRGLLLKNKMKVLIISEPTTDISAVALNVNIGYLSDPDDLPGLAHFCEHMLFLGTEKYPEKNDYSKYLSQNGGRSNGLTHMDLTLYNFYVHAEKLRDALDRFAQFFIAPLFTEALTELELNAIHSEYEKNLANDKWRIVQIEKSSADPNHPYSKFDSGNKETLEVNPKKNGINVRDRLLQFHKEFYSANAMALCVLGKESLDELEKMVAELFSPVENKEIEVPVWLKHPFNEEHFQTKWYTVPLKDIRHLYILFPLPDLRQYYKEGPTRYISYLLGHEGEGSLLSALKANGWCNSLGAGKRQAARGFSFFVVTVDLTEEGIQHVDDIIELMFQYINMLRKHGPTEWIYNECRDIANMNFRFREKSQPYDYVTGIAQILYDFPIEDILTVDYLFQSWSPELINSVMDYLKPQNVRVHVIGKLFENIADETEKWYGTKFKKEKIPEAVIKKWIDAGLNPDLKLPSKNVFIPEKFDIKPVEDNITNFPVIVEDTPLLRLWFKQDNEFFMPRANLYADFVSPLAYMDPITCNLRCLFGILFQDALNEYAYAADIAGLKWDLVNNKNGMTLVIAGYDDKQHVLLNKIMDKMVNFKVDPKRYEILKESYIRSLKNFEHEQPYQHAVYYLSVLLSEQVWTEDELLEATSQLTIERVQQFIPQFLSKIHIECLIHGNVTASEAIEAAKLIESKLVNSVPQIIPLLPIQLILSREIKLENGCHLMFEVAHKHHNSSCTDVYYQIGMQSTEANMLLELLSQILSEPCFTTLRTKEQLGYIVFCGVRKINGTQGLNIIVQSDRHPQYVEKRIDLFLQSMLECVTSMPETEFNAHKESLAVRRLEKPSKMKSLSNRYWSEISYQEYNFDRVNIEVGYLKTITQEQIIKFYNEMLQNDIKRKLAIHVIATNKDSQPKDEITAEPNKEIESADEKVITASKIDDIMAFKINHGLYPLLKPFSDIPRKGARSSKL